MIRKLEGEVQGGRKKAVFQIKLCHSPQTGPFECSANISKSCCSSRAINLVFGFCTGFRPGNVHALQVPSQQTKKNVQSGHLGLGERSGYVFTFISCYSGRCPHSSLSCFTRGYLGGKASCKDIEF